MERPFSGAPIGDTLVYFWLIDSKREPLLIVSRERSRVIASAFKLAREEMRALRLHDDYGVEHFEAALRSQGIRVRERPGGIYALNIPDCDGELIDAA